MKNKINYIKDYQRMWRFDGQKFIHLGIFLNHYSLLEVMQIKLGNLNICYIPKRIIDKTNKEGLELFSNIKRYSDYKKEFLEYRNNFLEFIKTDLDTNEKIKKEVFEKFMEYSYKIFYFSSKTEFFYTDLAYLQSKDNQVIKSNLDDMYKLKEYYRENLMNKIFLGENSEFNKLIKKLSLQFNIDYLDLMEYDLNEILGLYNGIRIPLDIIEKRRIAVAGISNMGKIIYIIGEEAKKDIEKFLSFYNQENLDNNTLKGIIANSGKYIGKVKVILSDFNTYDNRNDEFSKMNKGDVLVTETTSPDLMIACRKAGAIVTNQGGLLSHAAVISRELKIPCIVGTIYATEILSDGDLVEVDAFNGIVKIIEREKL